MANIPQIILTLNPAGEVIAELPGSNGSRRQIPIQSIDSIRRILMAQRLSNEMRIGHESAPTIQQVQDWETVAQRIKPHRLAKSSEWGEELGL